MCSARYIENWRRVAGMKRVGSNSSLKIFGCQKSSCRKIFVQNAKFAAQKPILGKFRSISEIG